MKAWRIIWAVASAADWLAERIQRRRALRRARRDRRNGRGS